MRKADHNYRTARQQRRTMSLPEGLPWRELGDRPEHDEKRTAWLAEQRIEIVRLVASEVLADPLLAAEAIVAMCRERGA